jgi:hypothetical protein
MLKLPPMIILPSSCCSDENTIPVPPEVPNPLLNE